MQTLGWLKICLKFGWLNYDLVNQEIKIQNIKILLIVNNAPSHVFDEFSNIEMLYLPKNTTSLLQPLDMGIIKAFKNDYQNYLIDQFIDNEKDDIDSSIVPTISLWHYILIKILLKSIRIFSCEMNSKRYS